MVREGVVEIGDLPLARLSAELGGALPVATGAVRALAAIEVAAAGQLSLYSARIHRRAAERALGAGAHLLVTPELAKELGSTSACWVHPHAAWVFATLLTRHTPSPPPVNVDPSAVVEAGVVLCPGVRIGARARIGAGSVIGRPGFGFALDPDGRPFPIPHLGGVQIADDVWIGACCTIDAGVLLPTSIGADTKLDSHVHVGHNVVIGRRVRVAAQVGFAGSVVVGDDVMIGGQAGFADHVRVGAHARIAAKAGVIGDVPERAVFAGYPAVSRTRWLRGQARLYGRRSSP